MRHLTAWTVIGCAALGAASLGAGEARADGDADAGKAVFSKCALCHSAKEGENKVGPSLWGVVGRKSHSIEGFNYSEAMKAYDVTWDPATLDHYLTDPRAVVPGTRMIFVGLKKDEDRANVIAYLETLK
jgi:cytochrome c